MYRAPAISKRHWCFFYVKVTNLLNFTTFEATGRRKDTSVESASFLFSHERNNGLQCETVNC
jgi:hypothetical protein